MQEAICTGGTGIVDDALGWSIRSVRNWRFVRGLETRLTGLIESATSPVRSAFFRAVGKALIDPHNPAGLAGRFIFRHVRGLIAQLPGSPQVRAESTELIFRMINRVDPSWQATRQRAANAVGMWVGELRPFGFAVDDAGRVFQIDNIMEGTVLQNGRFVIDYSKWTQIR